MAIEIGKVISIQGTAEVTHSNGVNEALKVGSSVYENDVISTGKNSSIEIDFNDGSNFNIGAEFTAWLNSDVYDAAAQQVAALEDLDAPAAGVIVNPIGVVIALEGDVMVLRDGELIKLEEGDSILPGDVIQTGEDASAKLEMLDGSAIDVIPNFILTLNEDTVGTPDETSRPLPDEFPSLGALIPDQLQRAIDAGSIKDPTAPSSRIPNVHQ